MAQKPYTVGLDTEDTGLWVQCAGTGKVTVVRSPRTRPPEPWPVSGVTEALSPDQSLGHTPPPKLVLYIHFRSFNKKLPTPNRHPALTCSLLVCFAPCCTVDPRVHTGSGQEPPGSWHPFGTLKLMTDLEASGWESDTSGCWTEVPGGTDGNG